MFVFIYVYVYFNINIHIHIEYAGQQRFHGNNVIGQVILIFWGIREDRAVLSEVSGGSKQPQDILPWPDVGLVMLPIGAWMD